MSPVKIIALDLGKFKTVGCVMDVATRQHVFETIEMSPQNVHDLIARQMTRPPADTLVVLETCDPSGWVHDLCTALGVCVTVVHAGAKDKYSCPCEWLQSQGQAYLSLPPAEREMMFVSTADGSGNCDCTVRCGEAGFVVALDDRTLVYPEYRGNGVMASLGNISENPHIGLLLIDFERDCIGLHVNGNAEIVETAGLLARPGLPERVRDPCSLRGGRRPERWVLVHIHEAYVHCAKHLPKLAKVPKKIDWGTDDVAAKGGDYFGVSRE